MTALSARRVQEIRAALVDPNVPPRSDAWYRGMAVELLEHVEALEEMIEEVSDEHDAGCSAGIDGVGDRYPCKCGMREWSLKREWLMGRR